MKCPLMFMTWQSKPDTKTFEPMNCLKEQCAWWSEGCKMCSITALASDIGFIAGTLNNIETKMPHPK